MKQNYRPTWMKWTAVATMAGFLVFTGAPQVRGDECQHRIERADHHLHDAVKHHGWDSPEADHARHELADARQYCWDTNHRWWDPDAHRWHTERDWDEDHGHPH